MDNQQIKSYDEGNAQYLGLWTDYKIRLLRGAYNELLRYPPKKEYITNSSALEDGVRYDIPVNGIKFDERSLTISCLLDTSSVTPLSGESRLAAHLRYLDTFISKISSKPFDLKIITLGKVFRLVYTVHERNKVYGEDMSTFTLALIEPNPNNRS